MTYRPLTLILAVPALMLGACGGTMNRGIEPVHQPVVAHSNYSFDLNTSDGHLAPGEAERLQGWLASVKVGYGDRIALDDPSGANAGARAEVAAIVERNGVFLADYAPVSAGELAPGAVRVIITRSTASVPGCPDFSRDRGPNFDQHTSSNYGCAINSTLAAMVARPDDLVRGQSGALTADPAVSTKAIQTFRKAANTGAGGLKSEGTSK